MRTPKAPEVTLVVTDQHFERAVPGDQCHCTIGEAAHDALGTIIPALGLKDADAATIKVNPADVAGEPVVSVGFLGTDSKDRQVIVRFLLREAAAFKVAYVTDNRASGQMRRKAAQDPYALRASDFKVRLRDAGVRPDTLENPGFTPEAHIKSRAGNFAHRAATSGEAQETAVARLEAQSKSGELPYKLTPALKKLTREAVAASFAAKGTKPRASKQVKVYKNKRFYGG